MANTKKHFTQPFDIRVSLMPTKRFKGMFYLWGDQTFTTSMGWFFNPETYTDIENVVGCGIRYQFHEAPKAGLKPSGLYYDRQVALITRFVRLPQGIRIEGEFSYDQCEASLIDSLRGVIEKKPFYLFPFTAPELGRIDRSTGEIISFPIMGGYLTEAAPYKWAEPQKVKTDD